MKIMKTYNVKEREGVQNLIENHCVFDKIKSGSTPYSEAISTLFRNGIALKHPSIFVSGDEIIVTLTEYLFESQQEIVTTTKFQVVGHDDLLLKIKKS